MSEHSRRDFLRGTLAAGVVAGHPRWARASATKRSATDWVTLGNSGVKVTRLAFGTGSYGGRVQRELGQEGFTRLVRHAYDRRIRFFESADAYSEMHEMLAISASRRTRGPRSTASAGSRTRSTSTSCSCTAFGSRTGPSSTW
ncbi:MAG TPA: twin-arginine translocation signal domain-containing protein, partial [Thermoanaerobaculia bacterium]|nr:twin-arginine translocation signal domain-containing protein [Thermoanaerobaculia bacterium]